MAAQKAVHRMTEVAMSNQEVVDQHGTIWAARPELCPVY